MKKSLKNTSDKLEAHEIKTKMPGFAIAMIAYYAVSPLWLYYRIATKFPENTPEMMLLEVVLCIALDFVVFPAPVLLFRFAILKRPIKTGKIGTLIVSFLYCALAGLILSIIAETTVKAGWIMICIISAILRYGELVETVEDADKTDTANETIILEESSVKYRAEERKKGSNVNSNKEPSEYELQMRHEYNRYTYLRQEVEKIPMSDVKQWHEEGKLTDAQYENIYSVYASMKNEMEDIRKRVRVMNQTNPYKVPDESVPTKKNKQKRYIRISLVVAWCSSLALILCLTISGVVIYKNYILREDVENYEQLYENARSARDTYMRKYDKLEKSFEELGESYDEMYDQLTFYMFKCDVLSGNIQSKLKIGDSKQTTVNKCGSPDSMVERFKSWGSEDGWTWYYGTSYVLFDTDDKVEGWYIGDTELPVD